MKKWIEIGKAEITHTGNDIFYSACVTVGKKGDYGKKDYRAGVYHHPKWTAYNDANFWDNVATQKDFWDKTVKCCTCCNGHKIKLDYKTLTVFEEIEE